MSSLLSLAVALGRCRRCAPTMGLSVGSVTTSRTRCTTGWRSAIASLGRSLRRCACRGTRWRTGSSSKAKRRPFTYDEIERLFDTADARVELLVSSGRKGALGALRDAQLLKTVYAFGLRRTEAVMLDTVDLHHNAKMRQWGRYGAVHVRWAKAAGGGAPRRRTVLLVPEFDWWVPGMQQWLEQARARFAPGDDLDALWVTERRTRLSAGYLDRRFAELRDEAGLSKDLTLHSLRHSYVTHLLEFGYADRFVQEQVGHMHASTTSIYASVSSDYKNRVLAEALKALIEGEADDR